MPVHVIERRTKLERLARTLEAQLGRDATDEELAAASGLPLNHVREALGAVEASVSLNQSAGGADESELGDAFPDPDADDPLEEADEAQRRHSIRRALAALPERERRIVVLRYGFVGERGRSTRSGTSSA